VRNFRGIIYASNTFSSALIDIKFKTFFQNLNFKHVYIKIVSTYTWYFLTAVKSTYEEHYIIIFYTSISIEKIQRYQMRI